MDLVNLLEQFKAGNIAIDEVVSKVSNDGMDDMGFVKIDTSRVQRTGIPEVIYGSGKTVEQVHDIILRMYRTGIDILATRVTKEMYEAIIVEIPDAIYNEAAKTIVYHHQPPVLTEDYICVVSAGTSDIPVAEEAVVTAEFLGNRVEKIYDVGVAGIHRLFNRLEIIQKAKVIIVIAGMEGALASVIGGLVSKPVIGVPTSIGYGANFGGLSALLSMLNSCASGVTVVNIDNGFGAACQANLINKL